VDSGQSLPPGGWSCEDSIWQLVESGGYGADLPLWTRLGKGRRVLDLGAGIGRVAHHIAGVAAGVTGLDADPRFVADFNRLAPAGATARVADVLDPGLCPGEFDLVIAPQQLVQIIGGRYQRKKFFRMLARSLAEGGTAAITITGELPRQSMTAELTPDLREIGGWVFSSRPTALRAAKDEVTVERIRHRVSPSGDLAESISRVSFSRITANQLIPELESCGLFRCRETRIPPTDDHMGSAVLLLGRPRGRQPAPPQ